MLSIEGVCVYYGRVQAVRHVSLTVAPGEIVALLGANGAGKSSLLRAVVGLQTAAEGQITWNGQRLDPLSTHKVARAGVILVPEGRQILHTMTVRDNLLLGGYTHHTARLRDLLGPVGWLLRSPAVQGGFARVFDLFPRLAERQGQIAGSLSGGEQQMLAIGRALMSAPQLLLLDEPSVGLAPNLVQEILQTLVRLRADGLTVLLVEQDAHAALRIADRGYVMETGRIAAVGTAKELRNSELMRRAYLGGGQSSVVSSRP
jgi:branched-chain amino acid transport system ATP-binding protein